MITGQRRLVTQAVPDPRLILPDLALFNEDGTPFDPTTVDTSTLATKASPAFTGNPTAPTPPLGDNDTSIANTEFVNLNAGKGKAAIVALTAVSAADAAPSAAAPTKAEFDVLVTLANANKAKINAIITALKA